MPETFGLPEPEPTHTEQVRDALTQAIAGQGIVRRIVLYLIAGSAQVILIAGAGVAGVVFGTLGIIALLLLSMTDHDLG